MNDDWFFIWAGITTNNSLVVTNDLLRDHINTISVENIYHNLVNISRDKNINHMYGIYVHINLVVI